MTGSVAGIRRRRTVTGALSFTLPTTADKLVCYRSGNSWVLDNRRALMIVIR